jgi:hypothetical protein
MKGYCYLDIEGSLGVKDQEFIDVECPYFWQQNSSTIELVWKFDTDDMGSILSMCKRFENLKLKTQEVRLFLQKIGLTWEELMTYASSIQSGQNKSPVST